jgi:stress-induced morphogen
MGEQYTKLTHAKWTKGQIARMHEIMDETAASGGRRVGWQKYEAELGHTLAAIRIVAARLYQERHIKQQRALNRALRKIADAVPAPAPAPKPKPAKPIAIKTPPPKIKLVGDSHCIATSTQSMMFAAEMRSRFEGRASITAGQFGDPLPGRSALDQRVTRP